MSGRFGRTTTTSTSVSNVELDNLEIHYDNNKDVTVTASGMSVLISVTRLGDLLNFEQVFKAFGTN